MTVTIHYRGQDWTGRIIDEMERYGETFYTLEIKGFKVTKNLHHSHVKNQSQKDQ